MYKVDRCAMVKGVLSISIDGTPVAKERPRRGKYGGFYTPPKTATYEKALKLLVQNALKRKKIKIDMECRNVRIKLGFFVKDKYKADIDNLTKSVLDSMNTILYSDDKYITHLEVYKLGMITVEYIAMEINYNMEVE